MKFINLLNNNKIKLNLTEISTLYSTYGKETIKTCDADDYERLWNKPPLLAFLATSRTPPLYIPYNNRSHTFYRLLTKCFGYLKFY